jgi:hypothetical protein
MKSVDYIITKVYKQDSQLLDSIFNTNHDYKAMIYPANVLIVDNTLILFHSHGFVLWDNYEIVDFQIFKKQFSKLAA